MTALPKEKIMEHAKKYEKEMTQFLRDMIAIPSESSKEKEVVQRIKKEMEEVGFDEIKIDGLGNILGRIGKGKHVIAMDAHIDTVGIGDPKAWKCDPYQGKLENGVIWGRGASDQEGGMASMVYGAKIIKDLDLHDDYTLWITGTVQEEDCDGLCWKYIIEQKVLDPKPEIVVITEPTNLNVYRGHRGRMEIGVTTRGVSCHGSAPERGVNAVYMMSKVVAEIEKLNTRLKDDKFLGKGTVTVSYIECNTPSLCAVPDRAYIHLDRRLTNGETKESAVAEVKDACERAGIQAQVEILNYEVPAYTGLAYPMEKYYPTWVLDENHPGCRAAVRSCKEVMKHEPKLDKWTFSTNGIATMGLMKIPTVGFGPANEVHAHTVIDQCPVEDLVKAAAFYASFPKMYLEELKK